MWNHKKHLPEQKHGDAFCFTLCCRHSFYFYTSQIHAIYRYCLLCMIPAIEWCALQLPQTKKRRYVQLCADRSFWARSQYPATERTSGNPLCMQRHNKIYRVMCMNLWARWMNGIAPNEEGRGCVRAWKVHARRGHKQHNIHWFHYEFNASGKKQIGKHSARIRTKNVVVLSGGIHSGECHHFRRICSMRSE